MLPGHVDVLYKTIEGHRDDPGGRREPPALYKSDPDHFEDELGPQLGTRGQTSRESDGLAFESGRRVVVERYSFSPYRCASKSLYRKTPEGPYMIV